MKIIEIKGSITTQDGVTREFSITTDVGWQQWGSTTEALEATVDALEVMTRALCEDNMLVSDSDDEDETGECEKCSATITRDGTHWRDESGDFDCPMGGQHYTAEG